MRSTRKPIDGRCLLRTMRQTVSGVASKRPTDPQSQVQKMTATRRATGDTPALWP
jgi:hypothetical protein